MSSSRIRDILVALGLLIVFLWFFNLPSLQGAPRTSKPSWLHNASVDALNETLGFQDVLVINLPSRPDRRDGMTLAGAVTGIKFHWIDGVSGDDISDGVRPADSSDKRIREGNKGSWRAHMNALREVVERDLATALILEDDIDWDVRLKSQLRAFSVASRGYLNNLRSEPSKEPAILPDAPLPSSQNHSISVTDLPETVRGGIFPYGDDWDVLWLGHCGTDFPGEPNQNPSLASQSPSSPPPSSSSSVPPGNRQPVLSKLASHDPAQLPLLRVTIPADETVPGRARDLRPHPLAGPDALSEAYPAHTRVVHAASGTICTQGYAVSQRGARRLLWLFGTQTMTTGWDLMLRDWCDGYYRHAEDGGTAGTAGGGVGGGKEGNDGRAPTCLTVQPPLFSQHYGGSSGGSDITAPGGGLLDSKKESTPYVRLSVKMNLGRLARGDAIETLVDQWPDQEREIEE